MGSEGDRSVMIHQDSRLFFADNSWSDLHWNVWTDYMLNSENCYLVIKNLFNDKAIHGSFISYQEIQRNINFNETKIQRYII